MADGVGTHVCTFPGCNKRFKKNSRLQSHYLSHTGERPHICSFEGCNKAFKRVDHLSRHQQVAHVSDEEQNQSWECEESDCESTFSSVYALKKHIAQCHERDTYKCTVIGCEAVFNKHHQLKTHKLEEHAQGRLLCCPVAGCGKAFPTQNKLKRHQKIHEGYTCTESECGKKFDKWSLLVKHKKVDHATVHECPECKKTFSQKQWLKQHMLTHADRRMSFICNHDNCGRSYLDQRNLNAHIRSYHEGKRFSCEHDGCSQTFTTKQKLQQHQKLHDPNRPLPKKARKKKSKVEKLLGISLETESRGQDHATFYSPNREDSIDLPDLSHLHADKNIPATLTSPGEVKEEYIQHSEMMETILQTALRKVKSIEKSKHDDRNEVSDEIGHKESAEIEVIESDEKNETEINTERNNSEIDMEIVKHMNKTEKNSSNNMEFSIYILDGSDGNLQKVNMCSNNSMEASHNHTDTV
ncbi:transcription factor IIIA-like [Ruditapes philippinarum]|uniref:transcription factor IIIA-like n=1 Tax=Ruditapes philippinarum TaxID=129788 RepID=UPI00295A5E79|nr:transcription factor IIIA-like [Ruditapes philippinarum]